MKKSIVILFLFFLFSSYASAHSYYYLDKFKSKKIINLYLAKGLKFIINTHLERLEGVSSIKPSYKDLFKKDKKLDVVINALIEIKSNTIYINLSLLQSGISKIKVSGKIQQIGSIINALQKKLKAYLGFRNVLQKSLKLNYKNFKLLSSALSSEKKFRNALVAHRRYPNNIFTLIYICQYYLSKKKYDKSLVFIKRLIKLSQKNGHTFIAKLGQFYLSKYYFAKLKLRESIDLLEPCIKFYNEKNKIQKSFLSNILYIKSLRYADKIDKGLEHALKLKKSFTLPLVNGMLVNQLGALEFRKKNYLKSENYFKKSLTFYAKNEFTIQKAKVFSNIIALNIAQSKYKQAYKQLKKLVKIIKNNMILYIYNYLHGEILYLKKMYFKAIKFFSAAEKFASKENHKYGILISQFKAAKCLFLLKRYKRALSRFNFIIKNSRGLILDKIYGWSLFYGHLCFHKMKNKQRSISYLKRSIDILGFTNSPALPILKKRLKNIKEGKKTEKLYHVIDRKKEKKKEGKKKPKPKKKEKSHF